jgi:hypothetical protein
LFAAFYATQPSVSAVIASDEARDLLHQRLARKLFLTLQLLRLELFKHFSKRIV